MRYICLILAIFISLAASAETYVVCVGIADYGGHGDLKLPPKDANTIAWIYKKYGAAKTVLLTDSNAYNDNIIKAIEKTFAKAKEDDTVIFFFSGHGYKGSLVTVKNKKQTCLPYFTLTRSIAKCKAKNKIILIDACQSGSFRKDKKTERQDSLKFEQEARKANVMLLLSSRDDESSLERPDMNNGYFTTYLKKGLSGQADQNSDRIISADEIYKYVKSGVARQSAGKQNVVIWGNFDGDMPVIRWDNVKQDKE